MASRYKDRKAAAAELTSQGIKTSKSGLDNLAFRGSGPKYVIINGRALYTQADLDAWVAEQAARPVIARRSRQKAAQAHGAEA